jgi:hypothetical protein
LSAANTAKERIPVGSDSFTVNHFKDRIGADFNAESAAVAFYVVNRNVTGFVGSGGWDWHNRFDLCPKVTCFFIAVMSAGWRTMTG